MRKLIALLLIFIIAANTSWAAVEKPKCLKGIELLTGIGSGKLREQGSYHPIPFFLGFDFDLKPLIKKFHIDFTALCEFVLEPFLSYSYAPYGNMEFGNNFLIKIGFLPETSKFQPYFKGGAGLIYLTQHTREQGTQFNFNEIVGLGMHYFFKKNIALTIEYRYRHISNAGIDKPNKGINTSFGICGISYRF